jgi:ketosteroid isomerase-like protein
MRDQRSDFVAVTANWSTESKKLVEGYGSGPFDPPLRGREAIREYWKDISLEQAEISFRFGEIYLAGPWFATEIRCTFRRRRKGEMVDIRGALFCETRDGKIAEMRLYWHRTTR